MTYALVIPPELLGELVAVRSATGISIRRQVLDATRSWLEECKQSGLLAYASDNNMEVRT